MDWTSASIAGIAGIVAGVAFGLLIQFAVGAMQAVGALVGAPNVAAGWILHVALSFAFIWPVWLNALGFPPGATLQVPHLQVEPFVGQLVYGAILGAVYAVLE